MGTRKNRNASSRNKKKPDLRAVYDRLRREFSAADLQKYTVIEAGIPLEKVIAEMEEIHRKVTAKKR